MYNYSYSSMVHWCTYSGKNDNNSQHLVYNSFNQGQLSCLYNWESLSGTAGYTGVV